MDGCKREVMEDEADPVTVIFFDRRQVWMEVAAGWALVITKLFNDDD